MSNEQTNKYHPFVDVGGPILVTYIDDRYPKDFVVIENITPLFEGKKPKTAEEGGVGLMFTFVQGKGFSKINLGPDKVEPIATTLDVFRADVESFWEGKLEALTFSNIPGLNVGSFCGLEAESGGAVQWNHEDLNRLVAVLEKIFSGTIH